MQEAKQYPYEFSLVIAAFNEEENVDLLMEEIRDAFREFHLKGEVIFVDDGSTDDTFKRALSQKEKMPFLKVLQHRRNLGKTEGILTGIKDAESGIIIMSDADLQYSPSEIPSFLRELEKGYDIVTGRKVGKYEKKIVSAIYNRVSKKIFDVPITDMNSMKAFRKEILDDLYLRHDWHRFFVALACNSGYKVGEIDVKLHPRRFGEAKYSGYGRIIIGILDLLAVKFKVTFARKPLLFFGTIGFALMSLGGAVGIGAICSRVFFQAGFRPLLYLVMLLIIVGFISLLGGFIGEIVGDVTDRIEKKSEELFRGK